MKKIVLSILPLLFIPAFFAACQGEGPETTASVSDEHGSFSLPENKPEEKTPVMPGFNEDAQVYVQCFSAEEATVGNMLYARHLQVHFHDNADGLKQENTVALAPNGAYRLVKAFTCEGAHSFNLSYTFDGSYERNGESLTLLPPDKTQANIDWGTLDGHFMGQSGGFTQQDSLAYPRAFNTPFLGDDNGSNEMYIILNDEEHSFEITGNQKEQERYQIVELCTERDGLMIYGNITLPADYTSGKLPVVIFAHGFIGNQAMQRDVALMLAEYGIASYRFDFCGGALSGCNSDGSFYEMSMLTEKADLHAVIDFIQQQEFTDLENIYLFGESMGGAVAALAAAERPDDIKGQFHFYPAYSISEQTRAAYSSEDMIPQRAPTSAGVSVARKFYADALSIDIYNEIAAYEGPVLMFHGSLDNVVPIVYVEKSLEVLNGAELVVYNGEGHGFTRQAKLKAVAKIIDFIKLEN